MNGQATRLPSVKVAALAGGVGGAKLLVGLQDVVPSGTLTAIVNTGDDAEVYGLHVSPDVDIVTYRLAGIGDAERGWGIRGDTFRVVDGLAALGHDAWFRLGDRDLATCLLRTQRLRAGATLSLVTDEIRRALEVPTRVLPMSDDPVRTHLTTSDGRVLEFQEYFVKERHEPVIESIAFAGAAEAAPAPGVLLAIAEAELVVLCPSNPILSIGPMLAVPGIRGALAAHPRVVAVTPIVRGAALKGPADRLLVQLGYEASASGVAAYYDGICNLFVVDATDEEEVSRVGPDGPKVVALPTVMKNAADSARLAAAVLAAASAGSV